MTGKSLLEALDAYLQKQNRKITNLLSFAVVPGVDTGSRNKVMVCVEFAATDPMPVVVGERELREAEERGYQRALQEAAAYPGPVAPLFRSSDGTWHLGVKP